VEVVGHEAVGQQVDVVAGEGLGQDAFEGVVVEDDEPCDGALQGVVDQAAFGGARWSTHDSLVAAGPIAVKNGSPFSAFSAHIRCGHPGCI